MKKVILSLIIILTFLASASFAQTDNKQLSGTDKIVQVFKTEDAAKTAESKLVNCPLAGTPDCPIIKNCPLAGTPDCPLVKNCPLAGTPDCPYKPKASTSSSTKKQKSDSDIPICCRNAKPNASSKN